MFKMSSSSSSSSLTRSMQCVSDPAAARDTTGCHRPATDEVLTQFTPGAPHKRGSPVRAGILIIPSLITSSTVVSSLCSSQQIGRAKQLNLQRSATGEAH